MKIVVIAVLSVVSLNGCEVDAVSTSRTDNADVQVDKLFTHDGCTVYRFEDYGNHHYFVKCVPPVQEAVVIGSHTEHNVATKTTTSRDENVETR